MKKSIPVLFDLLLILAVAAGVMLRFQWVNWNEGADLHPDEYGLTSTITRLSLPKTLYAYFNTRLSPISPYNKYDYDGQPIMDGPDNRMRWGQLPITLIRAAAELTHNTDYAKLRLMGRQISALLDSLSLLVIFLIGLRLYSRRAGLLAAALSALAVMQIQQAHFMTADSFGTLFTMLALYASVSAGLHNAPLSQQGEEQSASRLPAWLWYILAGIFLGAAVASRINLAVLAAVIGLAALLNVYNATEGFKHWSARPIWAAALHLALAAAFSLIIFRVAQPMSFRAPTGDTTLLILHFNPDWSDSMKLAQDESNGINAGPPGEQWTNRIPLVFPLVNLVVWGLGIPLGIAAWAGTGWALARLALRIGRWQAHLLPLAWAVGYFLFMGTRHVMSMRYFLPIYPVLCLMAAWALLRLFHALPERSYRWMKTVLPAALVAVVLLGTAAWAGAFVRAVYMQENTRIRATRWIFENIPGPFTLAIDAVGSTYHQPLAAPNQTYISVGLPFMEQFTVKESGVLTGLTIPHLRSMDEGNPAGKLRVAITMDAQGKNVVTSLTIPVPRLKSNMHGEAFTGNFAPVRLNAGTSYYLVASLLDGGTAVVERALIANEHWDESMPARLDGYDPFGQFYTGVTMEVRWPDDDNKRQMYRNNLGEADYIILPSQRSIWSISRLPDQYPVTMEYYRALFGGRLGFEQAALFQAPFQFGPLYISDLAGAAAWGQPPALPLFNNRLLSAEEAFSVYDHAPVWIFKKSANFDLAAARSAIP